MKHLIITPVVLFILLTPSAQSFAQRPPQVFFEGLNNYTKDPQLAKTQFLEALSEDSIFFGSYNFLGIIMLGEKKYDSAVFYLKNAVRLNSTNVNHTKEMSLERLCRAYMYTADFENAYHTALQGARDFPENKYLPFHLREICLWSYHVHFGGLSKDYVVPELKNSYDVNSVSQEYLILKNIKVNDKGLVFSGQRYDPKNNRDILQCTVNGTSDKVELVFNLGWDVLKTLVDKMPDYKIVYEDKQKNAWDRLGAILSQAPQTDLFREIEKLSQ